MWFNLVIRIEDSKMINADYLWAFIDIHHARRHGTVYAQSI